MKRDSVARSTTVSGLGDGGVALGDGAQIERLEVAVESLLERNKQLQTALESRIVIEQAKGVLAERFGIPVADAFELLRRGARSSRRKVHDLAAEVVESRQTPAEVEHARHLFH